MATSSRHFKDGINLLQEQSSTAQGQVLEELLQGLYQMALQADRLEHKIRDMEQRLQRMDTAIQYLK